MGRTVGDPEVGTLLVKQLAFENAKKHCKEALRPYRKKASLQDTIWLCSDVGGGPSNCLKGKLKLFRK
jgi:hypothetical protein